MLRKGMFLADRYEIIEQIGTGGMSDVYKAKCHKLNRYVAIKVMKSEFSEDKTFVSKFRAEAQSVAGFTHPNVVNVYDVGDENGVYYIVMELVEGITLKKYIEKRGKIPFKEAVSIAIQVANGLESEFAKVVDLIFETYKDFNITDYRCVLSLRDPEDKVKYHDDDEMWNNAENALRKVLNDIGIEYTEEIGEAAFYGPKLDVNVKPAIGNEYTLSTCQLDFCLPSKFNLTYIDKDGQRKTPVVLHRAILGSLDRFMAYILEETKGNLPLWLAPVQATILPVKNEDEELNAYAHGLYDYLADNGIRVEIDERAEKLGYRVREAQVKKIPYLIVLGKNEAAEGTVSYRLHGEQKSTTVSKDEFVAMLKDEIATKKNNPAAAK